ncbi:MAG: RNA 2',3'-cyclic phosphodiesterase [Candidatus Micrarchaeota archaeon]
MAKLFIAARIKPNDEILQILKLASKLKYATTVKPRDLHITLKFLGEDGDAQAEQIKKELDSLQGTGAFEIELQDVSAFPSQDFAKVLWVGLAENEGREKLISTARVIEDKIAELGFGEKDWPYAPHMTIGRVKEKPDGRLRTIFTKGSFGKFEVKEIELIRSKLTPSGPVYKTIHTVIL